MPPAAKNLLLFITVVFFILSCSDGEQHPYSVEEVPDPKKIDGGYVSNSDHIITEPVAAQINAQLATLDQAGKAQVAVVLLNSIGDQVPKDFAVALFNHWHLGSKEKDNGLLILLVKDQHRVEFETGYGLEGDLPDVTCFRIQQDYMVPYFRSDDYDNGMVVGVNALYNHLNPEVVAAEAPYASDTTTVEVPTLDYSEITWDENVYTIKTPLKMSFLQAWATIRNVNESAELPEIPDTTMSSVEQTADGYTYTIRIPYETSLGNALTVLLNSFVFFIIYGIIILVAALATFDGGRREYKKKQANEAKVFFPLFSNKLHNHNWFIVLFLLLGPVVVLEIYFFTYRLLDVPVYVSIVAAYLTWCAYVHLHYMILLPVRALKLSTAERHIKYEALSEAYRNLKIFAYIFPLPFLWLFQRWHRSRMYKLREAPYTCECGAKMVKLDELADNKFLAVGDVKEEELNSIDYDVWVCNTCNRQRVFQHENFRSTVMRCNSCSKKTVKLTQREVVSDSTTHSSGYGYNHFLCANCGEKTKIRFTIPKKSDSSSSSSSSGSSSSSSWGGGSSGGGGSGSSW